MNRILKEFGKGLMGRAFKDILGADDETFYPYPIPIDPSTHHTPDGQDGWAFQMQGSSFSYFKYENFTSAVKAYEKCPPISAIINRKAQAFTNGKVWVLNSAGKEAQSPQATRLRNLLKKPNPLQSWKQFEAQGYIYQQLFGFNIILPILPFGFDDKTYTSSMWNIPASWIDIKATEENFTRNGGVSLSSIVVNFNGTKITLNLKDLIIIRDNFPSFTTLTFPGSRIGALEMPINNIIGAFESRNVLINYRGALGILSSDPGKGQFAAIPMDDTQKRDLQRDFRRYGLRNKQWQVILTTASLKWQQMGYPTKDLLLMEEVQESTKSCCDGLNFPPHLLGLIDPTFNNQREAMKAMYQDGIMPDAESWYEQLTNWFQLDLYNLRIDKDFSHLPVLQEDKGQLATARKTLNEALKLEFDQGLITLDEWLVELGKDPLPNGLGNVRASDLKNSNAPLAVTIGVGGVQSLISILTATISPEAKQAALEIVFGLSPDDAQRMSTPSENNNNATQQGQGQQTQEGQQGTSGGQQGNQTQTNS